MINREKNILAKKYNWYTNPKYYLAATLIILAFRLITDALHTLSPEITMPAIMFSGKIFEGLFYLVIFVSLTLLIVKKGWQHA